MQHDEMIGQVQARAGLDSRGAAERAVRASLETLAERIPADRADKLAAQLPEEIGEHLRRVSAAPDEPDTGERFDAAEFVQRVAERADVDETHAERQLRAVFGVVRDATTAGQEDKLAAVLPDDVRALALT